MQIDATQIIVTGILAVGTLYTAWSMRRGQQKTLDQQRDFKAVDEKIQGVEVLDKMLTRAREDTENERRWRREDAAEHEAERAHDAQIIATLRRQLHDATASLSLLRRAVHDEAMQAAADLAIERAGDTTDTEGA